MVSIKQLALRTRQVLRSVVPQQEVPASILRRNGHERNNNNRNVQFGVFCTAQPFNKRLPPVHLSRDFEEEQQLIPLRVIRHEVVGSILLRQDRERNTSRSVQFSAICTVHSFKKRSSPANLLRYFQEVEQLIPLKLILHDVIDPIVLGNDRERNSNGNVRFSAISTGQPFNKRLSAENLLCGFEEERQLIPLRLILSHVEEEEEPHEEEEEGFQHEMAVTVEDSAAVDFEEQVEELISHVVVEEARPQSVEVLTFDDAGDEPAELIDEQYERKLGLRREVAALESNLGDYWSGELPAKRVRRRPERYTQ